MMAFLATTKKTLLQLARTNLALGSGNFLVLPGGGLLDVNGLLVHGVRARLEASVGLLGRREGDETEAAENSNCRLSNKEFFHRGPMARGPS
jgi:hypothetical protein